MEHYKHKAVWNKRNDCMYIIMFVLRKTLQHEQSVLPDWSAEPLNLRGLIFKK